ncbi:hypothetical protein [Terrabacter carboxydivorans]|uniref:hypothetical protein n=1 Tax=Terrabacter carboxydivorans TaxID=619730 RepID=UPI0031E2F773
MTGIVVVTWHPADASRLQRALRLTNEAFAETLGAAARTVAKWHANPSMALTLEMQAALDTLLSRASPEAQQRFEQLGAAGHLGRSTEADVRRVSELLSDARHLHTSLTWLDEVRDAPSGTTFGAVVTRAVRGQVEEPACAPSERPDRQALSRFLLDYYSHGDEIRGAIFLDTCAERLRTSLVTPDRGALSTARGIDARFELTRAPASAAPEATDALITAAEARLAACLSGRTRFVDQPTYRLLRCDTGAHGIRAAFGLSTFVRYGLTFDLLEAEAVGGVGSNAVRLELRDQLLPTLNTVLDPGSRECVGGALALTAFARPAQGGRPADFLLLVQERSSRVVNGAGRIAVIPKCFHQPTNEPPAEVDIRTTLLRELEEELFGRAEVDGTGDTCRLAEVLHPSRMTAPMTWLVDSANLDIRLTGFAYNLVAGSFEFPAVIAVQDETFWSEFGGCVEANWESSGLWRISSADADGIEQLLHDPRWSDEGLIAFALGLKQLAETNPDRVRLPDFEIGVTP